MARMLVLDQNVLQRPELPALIQAEPGVRFVLPDAALVEMTKSEQWEYGFQKSFAILRPIASRCYMSRSIQDARTLELETGKSCEGHLLPRNFRDFIRRVIEGKGSTLGTAMLERVRATVDDIRDEIRENDLNPVVLREELEGRVNELKAKLTAEEVSACRQEKTGRISRLLIARGVGDGLYQGHMHNLGVPVQVASRLKRQRCMNLRWTYLLAHHALQWLGQGGLDSAKEATVVNDVVDQDYVLTASFFDGVLTNEARVQTALDDLNIMLALPQLPASYERLKQQA